MIILKNKNSCVSGNNGFALDPNIDEFVDIADLLKREKIISFMYCIVTFYKYTSLRTNQIHRCFSNKKIYWRNCSINQLFV